MLRSAVSLLFLVTTIGCSSDGADTPPDSEPPGDTDPTSTSTTEDTGDTGTAADTGDTGTAASAALCEHYVEAVRTVYDPDDLQVPLFDDTTWYSGDGEIWQGVDHQGLDGALASSTRTTWDGDRMVSQQTGSSTGVNTITYDWAADGSSMVEELDVFTDGTVEERETNTYDTMGRRLSWESDDDGDGTLETRIEWTWQGDHPLTERVDLGADGTWDHETRYTLDASDRPVRSDKTVFGRQPDPNEIEQWAYDGDCLISYRYENYFFTNPTLRQWTYTCDAADHRVLQEYDADDDGIVDSRTEYDVDADGHVLEERHYSGSSTTPDRVIVRVWDAHGWQVSEEDDEDGDGQPDERWTETWRCVDEIPETPLIPGW